MNPLYIVVLDTYTAVIDTCNVSPDVTRNFTAELGTTKLLLTSDNL
jgi:hypothetical protein